VDRGRAGRDVEALGQLGVGQPLGHQRHDLALAGRERLGPGRLGAEAQPALDRPQLVDPPAPPAGQVAAGLGGVRAGPVGAADLGQRGRRAHVGRAPVAGHDLAGRAQRGRRLLVVLRRIGDVALGLGQLGGVKMAPGAVGRQSVVHVVARLVGQRPHLGRPQPRREGGGQQVVDLAGRRRPFALDRRQQVGEQRPGRHQVAPPAGQVEVEADHALGRADRDRLELVGETGRGVEVAHLESEAGPEHHVVGRAGQVAPPGRALPDVVEQGDGAGEVALQHREVGQRDGRVGPGQ
jgi:hypothetical protein